MCMLVAFLNEIRFSVRARFSIVDKGFNRCELLKFAQILDNSYPIYEDHRTPIFFQILKKKKFRHVKALSRELL